MIQARYRCLNENGWSFFSQTAYLINAGRPSRPPRPEYIDSDATSITLRILPVANSNGAIVKRYELYRDAGDYSSDVNIPLLAYDGVSPTYIVPSLTSGVKYRFTSQAFNDVGSSLHSF